MTLLLDRVREIGPALLAKATLTLRECVGNTQLYLRVGVGEPIYVGYARTKLEAYEALLSFKALGLGPQPDYLTALRAAAWLRGEMPTRLELPTAGDIRDFGRPESTPQRRLEFDFVVALALTLM